MIRVADATDLPANKDNYSANKLLIITIYEQKAILIVMKQKKHLGQHWLTDDDCLQAMVDTAGVQAGDVVLEAGPGPGALTKLLVKAAKEVVAVEFDYDLAVRLSSAVQSQNLSVRNEDILDFDFSSMSADYKVVANIPYYLTSALLRKLLEAQNKPQSVTLLIQKEVAERVAAKPGKMSILAVSAQLYADVRLGRIVGAELFDPPPQVDSQIIHLDLLSTTRLDVDTTEFFRIVKAGFGEKRKKLVNSLSGGLGLEKEIIKKYIADVGIDENARAQQLSLQDWYNIYNVIKEGVNV